MKNLSEQIISFLSQVCDNVTEISCEIVPYTKCKLEMINVEYDGYKDVLRPYTEKVCETFDKIVQHSISDFEQS